MTLASVPLITTETAYFRQAFAARFHFELSSHTRILVIEP